MPPPLPPRYRLEIRLGRDEDIEEWLATDLELNRPILIRVVGPDASTGRRRSFLAAVQEAARVSHNHVGAVFAADEVDGSVYAATEWTGGVTLADRIAVRSTPPIPEFLSNAAGLADGLATLHDETGIHGAIDPGAVLYSGSHPAKLAGFGRNRRTGTPRDDVRALSAALETSLTGYAPGFVTPSQVVDNLPTGIDETLRLAREGELDARKLAESIRSIPYSPPRQPSSPRSWRWQVPAALLAVAATGLVAWGTILDANPASPIQVPAIPGPSVTRPAPTATTITGPGLGTTPVDVLPEPVVVERVTAYDPLGDGQEHSTTVERLIDGDLATNWRTERYFDPLPRIKDGVGVAFEVSGTPSYLELEGLSVGTAFRILWADSVLDIRNSGWDLAAEERAWSASMRIPLPDHQDGVWLLWLTDLPADEDGVHIAYLAEVRFQN